jgi:hypothetical protein
VMRTEKILRLMPFSSRVSFELISRDVFKVGQCERNDVFWLKNTSVFLHKRRDI